MQSNMNQQVYAGFFVRLAAYLIDWIIVGAALLVIRIPIWIASLGGADFLLKDFIFEYSVYDIVLYLLKVTYFILLTYFTGATLGKKLLHIQVISTEDRKPTFFEIAFRETVGKFLSGLIICVGYIMVGADKQKRGLHDMLSDTYVVYHHRKKVAVPTPVTYNTVPYAVQMPPYQAGAAGQNPYAQPMSQQRMPVQRQQPAQPGAPVQGMPQQPAQPGAPVQSMPQQPVQPEVSVQSELQQMSSELSKEKEIEVQDSSKADTQEQ